MRLEQLLLLITKYEEGTTGDFGLRGRHIRKTVKEQKEGQQEAQSQHRATIESQDPIVGNRETKSRKPHRLPHKEHNQSQHRAEHHQAAMILPHFWSNTPVKAMLKSSLIRQIDIKVKGSARGQLEQHGLVLLTAYDHLIPDLLKEPAFQKNHFLLLQAQQGTVVFYEAGYGFVVVDLVGYDGGNAQHPANATLA